MDLFSYTVILGKSFLWTCRRRETLPSLSHFIRILVIKYETEKHIYFKLNKTNYKTTLLLRKIVKENR